MTEDRSKDKPVAFQAANADEDPGFDLPADDLILSWLSPGPCPVEPGPVGDDVACPSCGYTGEMIGDQGRSLCPACFGILPNPPDEGIRRIIHCPNCELEIKLSDADRNKTVVCSRCKYFLGCMIRREPSRHMEVFGIHLPRQWPFRRPGTGGAPD